MTFLSLDILLVLGRLERHFRSTHMAELWVVRITSPCVGDTTLSTITFFFGRASLSLILPTPLTTFTATTSAATGTVRFRTLLVRSRFGGRFSFRWSVHIILSTIHNDNGRIFRLGWIRFCIWLPLYLIRTGPDSRPSKDIVTFPGRRPCRYSYWCGWHVIWRQRCWMGVESKWCGRCCCPFRWYNHHFTSRRVSNATWSMDNS